MFTPPTSDLINQKIWQISELNQKVKSLLDGSFKHVWLEGEISNFSQPSSGHWYFSLKDSASAVRGAMFKFTNSKVSFKPRNGLLVVVKAKVSLYTERGEYQILVEKMIPSGEGALRLKFETLKLKLQSKGYFDEIIKKNIPHFPYRIGLITSPTGSVMLDMLHVLNKRFPVAEIYLYPCSVQGAQSAYQITQAIKLANKHKICDVLILARGGGSLEDLWPFNEEKVADAIFESALPIVSGIGHETDFTISDWVADKRAPTPSVAAEIISPDLNDFKIQLSKHAERLKQLVLKNLEHYFQKVDYLEKRIIHPKQQIIFAKERLHNITYRLHQTMLNKIEYKKQNVQQFCKTLEALSPLKILSRGFAVIKSEGKIIKSINQLEENYEVNVRLADGEFVSQIMKIHQK